MNYIGYVKYEGKGVENGLFDAKKAANALLGFDYAIRYFAQKEEPYLVQIDYELPVEIKKDSWDIFLPYLDKILTPEGIATIAATTYFTKAASKAATDGLFELGISKDISKILKGAFKSMLWVIKIVKHLKGFNKDNLNVKIDFNKDIAIISNDSNDKLEVPKKYFEIFKNCPKEILSKLVENIAENREMRVGVLEDKKIDEVKIKSAEKDFFYYKSEEKEENIILPELQDQEEVELEGSITKVNEKANTMGFQYKDYVLTILPKEGGVRRYKEKILSTGRNKIFRKVKIKGVVRRYDSKGEYLKKPKIIFYSLEPIEEENKNRSLFEDIE